MQHRLVFALSYNPNPSRNRGIMRRTENRMGYDDYDYMSRQEDYDRYTTGGYANNRRRGSSNMGRGQYSLPSSSSSSNRRSPGYVEFGGGSRPYPRSSQRDNYSMDSYSNSYGRDSYGYGNDRRGGNFLDRRRNELDRTRNYDYNYGDDDYYRRDQRYRNNYDSRYNNDRYGRQRRGRYDVDMNEYDRYGNRQPGHQTSYSLYLAIFFAILFPLLLQGR